MNEMSCKHVKNVEILTEGDKICEWKQMFESNVFWLIFGCEFISIAE